MPLARNLNVNFRLLLLSFLALSCQAMEEEGKTLIVVICKHDWLSQTFEGKQMADALPHYLQYDLQDLFRKEVQGNTDIGKRIELEFPAVMESHDFYSTKINKTAIPTGLFSIINSVLEKYIKGSAKQHIFIDSFPSDEKRKEHLHKLLDLKDSKVVSQIVVARPCEGMSSLTSECLKKNPTTN